MHLINQMRCFIRDTGFKSSIALVNKNGIKYNYFQQLSMIIYLQKLKASTGVSCIRLKGTSRNITA